MKLPDELETSGIIECRVAGCGWQAEIPVLYRIEPVGTSAGLSLVDTRVVVDEDAIAALDAYVAGHLEQHTIVETLLEHPDDPGPVAP